MSEWDCFFRHRNAGFRLARFVTLQGDKLLHNKPTQVLKNLEQWVLVFPHGVFSVGNFVQRAQAQEEVACFCEQSAGVGENSVHGCRRVCVQLTKYC